MNLESLLAFVGIMLGLSLAITIANQMVSHIFALRGRALMWGLTTMLKELHGDPMKQEIRTSTKQGPPVSHADTISEYILTHHLVSDSTMPSREEVDALCQKHSAAKVLKLANCAFFSRWRLATAIRFEELQRTLQLHADATLPDPDPGDAAKWKPEEARRWLSRNLLVTNEWFDSMMDRVGQRFAMWMRLCTIALSCILVFALHLDTFDIFDQLSKHPEGVARINAQVTALETRLNSGGALTQDQTVIQNSLNDLRGVIGQSGIRLFPDWRLHGFSILNGEFLSLNGLKHLLGILLTAALLSLGAPFWFNQLRNISSLRTVVAQKVNAGASTTAPPAPTITWQER